MAKDAFTPPHQPKPRLTLGPVADLEPHLPAEWWRELFDSMAARGDGETPDADQSTSAEVDAIIETARLDKNAAVLDLCCGQGRHALELARRGFAHVTGVDRSSYLIRMARKRAKKLSRAVAFKEGDPRAVHVAVGSQDAVCLMGNAFGYFDRDEDDLMVLKAVKMALKPGGTLVLDIVDGAWMRDHFETRSWEWIDQNQFVCRERGISADGERLISREVVTHAERGVIADQLYAERLYTRGAIAQLLETAGFRNIKFHKPAGGEAGAATQRFLITCAAPKVARTQAPDARRPLNVAVVLGDPDLPDAVRPDGRFGPADLDAVKQLKDALGRLEGYDFTYLDAHHTLVDDLRASGCDLVLNLCDEGFSNDAFKTAHIPALLDVLDIPYTGSGPACLGSCFDKALVRAVALGHAIAVPLETYVRPGDRLATLPSVFPALLKPASGNASVGITRDAVVHDAPGLLAYLNHLHDILPGRPVLVQEFLDGPEYSVALLGNPGGGLEALPVLEVDYDRLDPALPRILGYEAKWLQDTPYWSQIDYDETDLNPDVQRALIQTAMQMFEALGCRDYARFDFRADRTGVIKLLEVNPNPSWAIDGKLVMMAGFAGMSYPELLGKILEVAWARQRREETRRETAQAWSRSGRPNTLGVGRDAPTKVVEPMRIHQYRYSL
ncbi:MAG: methyltransferase domain-containing protein [Alphaproteobacteria bacterium]|nr:methyltransferase domain-containing protein [Alphaproteobacteria bacterium]